MSIIQLPLPVSANTGVIPNIKTMTVTDSLATLTTAGYLNKNSLEGYPVAPTDVLHVFYNFNTTTQVGSFGIFTVSIAAGTGLITLTEDITASEVTYTAPSIANHIAVFSNTTGNLIDDAATAINGGNIQAGLSGTAGSLTSFPATASKGSLKLVAVANTGDTVTTISNVAMGQASVISIPDPAAATADFVVAPAALVSGNIIQASGTAGLVSDAGIATTNVMSKIASNVLSGSGQITLAKINGTEAANAVTASGNAGLITTSALTTAGGATYVITWTNTKITATSVIGLTIQGGTNNATNNITFTCVPGSGTATLTIFNNTAATSLNGTLFIAYSVL